ncbi:HPBP1 protein, partial [Amia calva]|nr:HPBP1 protein [Amia calva]
MAEGRGNRPHPQNLQGLLRLAVEASSASEGNPPPEPMSEERQQWLRSVLADMCQGGMDEVTQMKECLSVLRSEGGGGEGEGDGGEKEAALDLLCELCENMDNARDLMSLGGLEVCVGACLGAQGAGLRCRGAGLLAVCCQNHPEVQLHALALGALPTLLTLADTDPSTTVKVKALYAVSCLVREQEAGVRDFLSHDGFSVLMRGMQAETGSSGAKEEGREGAKEEDRLRTKSAFLLQSLLTSHPEHRDTLVSMGMVQQLVSLLRPPRCPFHEHVLGALCCLVNGFPRGMAACRDPALHLEELLNDRARQLKGKEECQEELEFCEQLLRSCFCPLDPEDNGMDR